MQSLLNIGIVAGRRPDLLSKTLTSFKKNLFDQVDVGCVRINIDPIFGDADDAAETAAIATHFFPNVEINQPDSPGFTKAVRWVWSGMPDGMFLHLEDDWICLDEIPIREIETQLSGDTKMVSLLSETHGARGLRRESVRIEKKKLLGLTVRRKEVPAFNTSPGIVDGQFARKVAGLFDLSKDPEKQMRDNRNPELCSYLSDYQCLFCAQGASAPIVEDIGREWARIKGIKKILEHGQSRWEKSGI